MKNTIIPLYVGSITLLCATLMGPISKAQSWVPLGTPGFSPSGAGVCNWQALQTDKNNNIYVAFNDEGQGLNNGQGTVMKFNGTDWVSIGKPGFTPGAAHHSSFALGKGDTVYYAFADGTAAGFSRASVMRYDGTAWSNIGSLLTPNECQYSNIIMSGDGSVYFACIDNQSNNNTSTVVVKKYAGGTTWNNVGAAGSISSNGASYTSMALDNQDNLHIAFTDKAEAPGKVHVKKFNGTSWVSVGTPFLSVTGGGASSAMYIHLAFNNKNKAYVAYSHGFQGPPRSSVHTFDGTSWNVVGTPQFASGTYETSMFNNLAFAPDGSPYLIYQHGGLGQKASVMKFNGTSWVNLGMPGFSAAISAHNCIVVDHNGNPYVAYFDDGNGTRTTVMKYTLCQAPVTDSAVALSTTICVGDTGSLMVIGTLNDATGWEWYSDSCSGASLGSGASIKVTPDSTTTYYVRGMGGCVASGSCTGITIHISNPQPTITANGNVLTSSAPTGNQWYINGMPIGGATGQQYTAIERGWYYVILTEGNCSGKSDSLFVQGTGIAGTLQKEQLSIFPVPFSHTLNVNFDKNVLYQEFQGLHITDQLGRTVYQKEYLESNNALNPSQLPQGLYFLILHAKDGSTSTFKILKQD